MLLKNKHDTISCLREEMLGLKDGHTYFKRTFGKQLLCTNTLYQYFKNLLFLIANQ